LLAEKTLEPDEQTITLGDQAQMAALPQEISRNLQQKTNLRL
jgi:hypothetical protein